VLNAGQGAAAWLAGGTFYVNQTITFKMSQQSILGQGRRVTTIVAADGFTGTQTGTPTISGGATVPTTAVIYTGSDNQFLTVDGLTIEGPSGGGLTQSSTTGQLNGLQQAGGAIRSQFTNLHFLNLNGWPFTFDGQGGNNAGMFVANALADNCFGVAYLQGNVGGYNGSGTMIDFAGVNMLTPAAGTPMYGQQPFLVQDYWDLLAWGATPSALVGECAICFFCSIDTGTRSSWPITATARRGRRLLRRDRRGGQREPVRDPDHRGRAPGLDPRAEGRLHPNHGVSVEGTGNQIFIRDCQFQNNGQLASGTSAADYYDLNWSGTPSGLARGFRWCFQEALRCSPVRCLTARPVRPPSVGASLAEPAPSEEHRDRHSRTAWRPDQSTPPRGSALWRGRAGCLWRLDRALPSSFNEFVKPQAE
jgi:hypothetical protein